MKKEKSLTTRGRTFVGKITSSKMKKTAVIEIERNHYIKKYERYEKRRTRIKAHNPENINATEGEIVKIRETRPISKTKKFTIIQKIKGDEKEIKK